MTLQPALLGNVTGAALVASLENHTLGLLPTNEAEATMRTGIAAAPISGRCCLAFK